MTVGMCACGGIYCKYCGDPYRASPYMHETSAGTNSASITLTAPDHGISPAQLREKVEALELDNTQHKLGIHALAGRLEVAHGRIDAECKLREQIADRLDAALRRIELLEHDRSVRSVLR